MAKPKLNEHVERAKRECFPDIGQLTTADRGALKRAADRGEIARWRGFWNTMSPLYGFGHPRCCYGPIEMLQHPGLAAA